MPSTKEHKASQKIHYQNNRAYYLEKSKTRNAKVKAANRAYIQELKERTPCADCGLKYPYYVMDFDHLRDKSFSIGRILGQPRSLEFIKAEIEKCEIVCSNCHRQRTHERSQS